MPICEETQCVPYDVSDWGNWKFYLFISLSLASLSFTPISFLPLFSNCQVPGISDMSGFVN